MPTSTCNHTSDEIQALKDKILQLEHAKKELVNRVQQRTEDLYEKTRKLMESNIALKVFLKQSDEAIKDVEERVLENTKQRVLPPLEKLKLSRLPDPQMLSLVELETNLNDILSPS